MRHTQNAREYFSIDIPPSFGPMQFALASMYLISCCRTFSTRPPFHPVSFIFWQRLDSIHLPCAVPRPEGFGYHTRTLPQKGETGDPILNFLSSHFVCSPTHPTRRVCFFVSVFEPRHLTYELGKAGERVL